MFKLLGKGLKSVAAGKGQADLGLQSPYLPLAITRIGRFFYSTSALWIATVWYSGYVNMRTQPGTGPSLVLPGKPIVSGPDRQNKGFSVPTFGASGGAPNITTNPDTFSQGSPGIQGGSQTVNGQTRTLVALGPNQIGVPGSALAGYLWSAPNNQKQMPAFSESNYMQLLSVANKIANRYGLRITSGYRPQSSGSMHAVGLAFDMVGTITHMKWAATWASQHPALFQEIFIHNEGSGIHLHLAFYPDGVKVYNTLVNKTHSTAN